MASEGARIQVLGLAVLVFALACWLHSLDGRLNDIEEHFKGIF